MLIQYYGDFCFKITVKPGGRATEDVVVWTDPVHKESGLRPVSGQADIVLLSHHMGERDALSALKGEAIVFETPGEYASHGLTIKGSLAFRDAEGGATRGQNTLFTFVVEDFHVCFLGALGHALSAEQLDVLGHVDVLFVPVGGTDTLPPHALVEAIHKIEPALVIPMHYTSDVFASTLDTGTTKAFCDEIGSCPEVTVPKLLLKKKDLEGKSMEVVLLEKM